MLQCAFLYRSADGAIDCRDVLCCVLQQLYAEPRAAVYVCFGATPSRQAFGRAGLRLARRLGHTSAVAQMRNI